MDEFDRRLRHRSAFELRAIDESCDPFMDAADAVVEWLVGKELRYDGSPIVDELGGPDDPFPRAWHFCMPEYYRGGDYDEDEWPAVACAVAHDEDGRVNRWAMEYDEPDANVEERRWHTIVYLESVSPEVCHVAVESMCRQPQDAPEELPETIAVPALVRTLIELPGCGAYIGGLRLFTAPYRLAPDTFDEFSGALVDPERTIPLVLFSTGFDGRTPEAAKQLARRAMGTANVYVLDWSNEDLRERLLHLFERGTAAGEYSCPRASARLYVPGVDLKDWRRSMRHESWNREQLAEFAPSKFGERLARRFLPNKMTPGVVQVEDMDRGVGEGMDEDVYLDD